MEGSLLVLLMPPEVLEENRMFYAKISKKIGKNKKLLKRSCDLGLAKDHVLTNQFDYFMDSRKQNSFE